MFWDKNGKPIGEDVLEWAKLATPEYRRVKESQVGTYWVSTVWIGMDYGYSGGEPLIFESMVFANSNAEGIKGDDVYIDRYSTLEQAERGHDKVVELLTAGTLPLYEDTGEGA